MPMPMAMGFRKNRVQTVIIKINNYNEFPTCLLNTGIHVYLSQRRTSRIVHRRMSTDVAFLSYT